MHKYKSMPSGTPLAPVLQLILFRRLLQGRSVAVGHLSARSLNIGGPERSANWSHWLAGHREWRTLSNAVLKCLPALVYVKKMEATGIISRAVATKPKLFVTGSARISRDNLEYARCVRPVMLLEPCRALRRRPLLQLKVLSTMLARPKRLRQARREGRKVLTRSWTPCPLPRACT